MSSVVCVRATASAPSRSISGSSSNNGSHRSRSQLWTDLAHDFCLLLPVSLQFRLLLLLLLRLHINFLLLWRVCFWEHFKAHALHLHTPGTHINIYISIWNFDLISVFAHKFEKLTNPKVKTKLLATSNGQSMWILIPYWGKKKAFQKSNLTGNIDSRWTLIVSYRIFTKIKSFALHDFIEYNLLYFYISHFHFYVNICMTVFPEKRKH